MNQEISVEIWGDLACFTRPESKVERLSYPVPTPSAMRGIFSAIYSKPAEFYWQITTIEVLKPIRYLSFKRNEVKSTVHKNPILVEDNRTQRQTVFLKDVHYRVHGKIIKRESFKGSYTALYEQALRRIKNGKCYYQPSLGCRECIAYFKLSDDKVQPIQESLDLGIMIYDVFDLNVFKVTPKAKPYISVYRPKLKNGIIEVPDFMSQEVLKPEEG